MATVAVAMQRGRLGSPMRVITNSFEVVRRPSATYHHYDVVIAPKVDNPRRAAEIIDKLQLGNPHLFTSRAAYDGRANLFMRVTAVNLTGEYTVNMSRDPTRNPGRGVFKVTLTHVAIIRPSDIEQLIAPQANNANVNTMAVNLVQIILRQAVNMKHGYALDAKSFYTDYQSKALGGGLSAWKGLFQSVRPVLNKLLINVDVSNALVYTAGDLLNSTLQFFGWRDARNLRELRENGHDWRRLKSFLKNVKVTVKTAPRGRPRPIRDIIPRAGRYQFDKDGSQMTVEAHFMQAHNLRLQYPDLFGVRIGKDAVFPVEVCKIAPGQLYKKKIPQALTSEFVRFATQRPDRRLDAIRQGVTGAQLLEYHNSDFIQESGMAVSPEPLKVTGRVLNVPRVIFGRSHANIRGGAWNVVGNQLAKPATVKTWAVVTFDVKAPNDPARIRFLQNLAENLRKLGVAVEGPPYIAAGNTTDVGGSLMRAAQTAVAGLGGAPPSIVIVMLPFNAPEFRRKAKHWGDVEVGVPTQCIREGKWERANDQYCNNVALKVNAKLGGVNSTVQDIFTRETPTMVVGMDVGHPGPGVTNRPSVTSLVASYDVEATRYCAFASVQAPRTEIIEDLPGMLTSAVQYFADRKNPPPERIIFYRDGVSDGEYAQVAQREVAVINDTLNEMQISYGPESHRELIKAFAKKPQIAFVVVGKRHHIRFFPENPQSADRTGNCPAGFIVDDQITNAAYPDFYLQSHSGIIGTSRPSHYIVLANEIAALTVDKYQEFSYHLCHVYASATRSVSIPAPVYCADRVCARAEFHFQEEMHFADSDAATTASGGSNMDFPLEQWKASFKQAADSIIGRMFFL
ncbi:Piwi-domain-containing protein [Laetiporus sulphureus 93-53]|uniref:Piwi-domain-containing protein n=1 Tax=Laetiporus sulphureus 93-53 TaxID=1314785 RepID=A0A165H9F7_9APHY|nr:Piwi-domain-containing protein [Laetiporus sulphureus 93-53]KZT11426.1 Piwi-domain-containing protein [Laetiporus sulphureus 93-53]